MEQSGPSAWMQANLSLLGNHPLRNLCIPGSHDSGMSTFNSGTVGAAPCNVVTQTTGVLGQLQFGVRYFDIRPVISAGQYVTGHYSFINSFLGWQGANGESIASVISDVNTYTAANQELVVLYLSHDLNTDVGEPNYTAFTQDEWTRLFTQLKAGLNHLFVAPSPTTVDLTMLTLSDFIGGGQAAVLVIVDPSGTGITLGDFASEGFYTPDNFSIFNQYSDTNDLSAMQNDQLAKLKAQRPNPDAGYFLVSWTLTQNATEASTCFLGTADSILDLAATANPTLAGALLPVCSSQTYPNILYVDRVDSSEFSALAMTVNSLATSGALKTQP